jgi:hypothetical protein
VIKKNVILEGIQIDTTDRDVFNLFEAAVLVMQKKWDRNRYSINDPHFVNSVGKGSDIVFKYDYESPQEFFEAMGTKYSHGEESVVNEIETLDSDYGYDDMFQTYESSMEDWEEGNIIKQFTDENFSLLMEYFKLRKLNDYIKLRHKPKDKQIQALTKFFNRDKNKYDFKMIETITISHQENTDAAYKDGYKEWIKDTYTNLKPYGIITNEAFHKYSIAAVNAVHQILVNRLDRQTVKLSDIIRIAYEAKNCRWSEEIIQNRFDFYDGEIFDNSSFQKDVNKAIKDQTENFMDEETEDKSSLEEMEAGIRELESMGVKIGGWSINNVTPDKKFKYEIDSVDIENRKFHVRLWDMDEDKSVAGFMSLDGVKKLATIPTLFDAEQMLNETIYLNEFSLPDKMRISFIEEAKSKNVKNISVTLNELSTSPIVYKPEPGVLEYNELWTSKDIAALRKQHEFSHLPLQEALDKFINERMSKNIKYLGAVLDDYEFIPHDNEQLEYNYWMKVNIRL